MEALELYKEEKEKFHQYDLECKRTGKMVLFLLLSSCSIGSDKQNILA